MTHLSLLRYCTLAEGISYLGLLFVAMPLKYWLGLSLATQVAGGVHGISFIAFCVALLQTHHERRWSRRYSGTLLLVTLIPGSLFWLDRELRKSA
jgi:integral membrane protein